MSILPVDNLDANSITLNNKSLIDAGVTLSFDGVLLVTPDQLVKVSIVANLIERDLLQPREGDVCKVTDTNNTFVYGLEWIPLQNEETIISVVSSIIERDLLQPNSGDVCNVTDLQISYIYSGSEWIGILTSIDDNNISLNTTYSSTKIENRIENHGHDGGTW